jgi:hypothetical protein
LFVATGVTGPQTVIAKATGFRPEMWVGANGANMTMNLATDKAEIPGRANLTASIQNWQSITVAPTHAKAAIAMFSQSDDIGDPANEIETDGDTNICFSAADGTSCSFTITTRTGRVALLAILLDIDTKGTPEDTDDTTAFLGYAHKPNLTVADGVDQTGIELAIVPAANAQGVTIDFGSPPSGLNSRAGIIGVEVGDDGVFQLPFIRTPMDAGFIAPKLDAIAATGYRVTGIAADGDPATQTSIVLRRDLDGPTLAAGDWLVPPATANVSRTSASWSPVAGGTVHSVELAQGTTRVLNVTVFDDTTEVTFPDLVELPSGAIEAKVGAIGAPGLDVTNFSVDEDFAKLSQVGQRTVTIP